MFKVKWPDGRIDDCYSPSTVIFDYLKEGESYNVKDFVELSSQALNLASDRVFKKFGFRDSHLLRIGIFSTLILDTLILLKMLFRNIKDAPIIKITKNTKLLDTEPLIGGKLLNPGTEAFLVKLQRSNLSKLLISL